MNSVTCWVDAMIMSPTPHILHDGPSGTGERAILCWDSANSIQEKNSFPALNMSLCDQSGPRLQVEAIHRRSRTLCQSSQQQHCHPQLSARASGRSNHGEASQPLPTRQERWGEHQTEASKLYPQASRSKNFKHVPGCWTKVFITEEMNRLDQETRVMKWCL